MSITNDVDGLLALLSGVSLLSLRFTLSCTGVLSSSIDSLDLELSLNEASVFLVLARPRMTTDLNSDLAWLVVDFIRQFIASYILQDFLYLAVESHL